MYSILHVDNSSFFTNILKNKSDDEIYKIFPANDIDEAFDCLGREQN